MSDGRSEYLVVAILSGDTSYGARGFAFRCNRHEIAKELAASLKQEGFRHVFVKFDPPKAGQYDHASYVMEP